MKVYIGKYRDHWVSPYTILEKVFFWREIEYSEPTIDRWADRLRPLCEGVKNLLDRIHPKITYVKIDKWDVWNMDTTLAHIILPMLKQLNKAKHGAPNVDDEDVPEELKSTSSPPKECVWDTDANHFKRWDWVMNEMIWAFEYKLKDTDLDEYDQWSANGVRAKNGFRLFGKYYEALWD
jgi:hypothetical protein